MLEVWPSCPEQVDSEGDAMSTEREIETEVRVALSKAHLQVWKHRVELCPSCGARPKRGQGLGLGAADLICIVPPHGRFVAIEMKSPKGRVADEQYAWLSQVRKYGGVAGVARSVDEAFALVELARKSSW